MIYVISDKVCDRIMVLARFSKLFDSAEKSKAAIGRKAGVLIKSLTHKYIADRSRQLNEKQVKKRNSKK